MLQSSVQESETGGQRRIAPWMPVLDRQGNAIGHVSDPAEEDGYLRVEKGFFFTRLVYVPLYAITRTDAFGVHLSMRKEDLNDAVFAAPAHTPAAAAIAG